MKMTLRRIGIALLLAALACTTTTSVTRSGSGIFAPRDHSAEAEDETPGGLSLSVESITPDGTARLLLRNYSSSPFVFAGTPAAPHYMIEVQSGHSQSRHTVRHTGGQTHEVSPGERIELEIGIRGVEGSFRVALRDESAGVTVWSDWFTP